MLNKWIGEGSFGDGSARLEKNALTIGQAVLVFAIMLAVYLVALMMLCGELFYRKYVKEAKTWAQARMLKRSIRAREQIVS